MSKIGTFLVSLAIFILLLVSVQKINDLHDRLDTMYQKYQIDQGGLVEAQRLQIDLLEAIVIEVYQGQPIPFIEDAIDTITIDPMEYEWIEIF